MNNNAARQTNDHRNDSAGETSEHDSPSTDKLKVIWGVVKRGRSDHWSRLGVAFTNRDGSLNLKFDFLPTNPSTTIQIRDHVPRDATEA